MNKTNFMKNNWLVLLMAIQPVLDTVAFFTQNANGTASGYVRLAIMIGLCCYCLFSLKNKKTFIISTSVVGAFCVLHVLNGFRVGYMNLFSDVKYIASVVQTPVLAICFISLMDSDKDRNQALRGIYTAAAIYFVFFITAVVTGTANSTYGTGVGVSGWVIDSNRCANSILLVTFCVFVMCLSMETEKTWIKVVLPAAVTLLLLSNGTKACYIAAVGLMASYAGYCVIEWLFCRRKLRVLSLVLTAVLFVGSIAAYPYTPRARQDLLENGSGGKVEDAFRLEMMALGYDLDAMTVEEKIADPVLLGHYKTYYYKMVYACVPQLLDDYGIERVMRAYNGATDAKTLIDTRLAKRTFAAFIFEDSDVLTRIVGYEFENIGYDAKTLDLENDWHAIYYYYGYLGFALFAGFTLWFLFLVLRRLFKAFKASITPLNFSLLVCYTLQITLAELSGALLRRAHVSVFFALVLALIYYQTVKIPLPSKEE